MPPGRCSLEAPINLRPYPAVTPYAPLLATARERPGTSVRGPVIAFATVAVVIIGMTYAAGVFYERRQTASAGETLLATAQLQSELISRNVAERLMDAHMLSVLPMVWGSLNPTSASTAADRRGLVHAVEQTRETYGYKQVSVVDAAADLVYSTSRMLDEGEPDLLLRAIAARAPAVVSFRLEAGNQLEYGAIYPVFAQGDSTKRVVGAVLLEHDAVLGVLPLLTQMGGRFLGGESVLLQRTGDSVFVVVAPTTGSTLAPMSRGFPLNDTSRVAAQLYARSRTRAVTGNDYRDVPVVAAGTAVARTPWLHLH